MDIADRLREQFDIKEGDEASGEISRLLRAPGTDVSERTACLLGYLLGLSFSLGKNNEEIATEYMWRQRECHDCGWIPS